ncbi:Piso0_001718 [Millerozyma farinosa CBS 7064]|uniref:Piso0_001718 protein n=1 Tax=Pichia sorbitophila (strain ATCC MYA-4447 / BCRC 22081 / CBS 7064 / NBRC 10061 / NRRL Y-12695) TaxID=559304 RepID=G8YNX0_PICSO|nr:Piso0_001718 [Millerozyma farinosa CBS 7064]
MEAQKRPRMRRRKNEGGGGDTRTDETGSDETSADDGKSDYTQDSSSYQSDHGTNYSFAFGDDNFAADDARENIGYLVSNPPDLAHQKMASIKESPPASPDNDSDFRSFDYYIS